MFLKILGRLFRLLGFLDRKLGFRSRRTDLLTPAPPPAVALGRRLSIPPSPKEASFPMVVEMTIAATCNRDFGSWTSALVVGSDRKELEGSDTLTTKDRLELTAAIAGLSALKRRCGVELFTDSTYLLQAPALFLMWKLNPKRQIRNQFLWDQLYEVASRHDVNWRGPRSSHSREFAGVMTQTTSEIQGRTQGTGRDTNYLYAGTTSPWCASLDNFRSFTDDEILEDSVCSHVVADDTGKQARERTIARASLERTKGTKRELEYGNSEFDRAACL